MASSRPTIGSWFASFVPSMNFTVILSLVVAILYLAGVLVSYSACGNQGACTVVPSSYSTCSGAFCQSWTIIIIVVSVMWLTTRIPPFRAALARAARGSVLRLYALYLPMLAGMITLLVTAILAATRVSGDDVNPDTWLSNGVDGGGATAVLWLLWGLWTASMLAQGWFEVMFLDTLA